jgi:hypothetical protein
MASNNGKKSRGGSAGRPLTAKQEALCLKHVKGGAKDKTAAYRAVYDCSRMKPETVNVKAHIEFGKDKVRARVEELQAKLEDEAIADAKERLRFWTQVMRGEQSLIIDGEEKTLPCEIKDRLKASELLGKANGDFVDRKILQNPDGTGINQPPTIDYSKLSDAALEELRAAIVKPDEPAR